MLETNNIIAFSNRNLKKKYSIILNVNTNFSNSTIVILLLSIR